MNELETITTATYITTITIKDKFTVDRGDIKTPITSSHAILFAYSHRYTGVYIYKMFICTTLHAVRLIYLLNEHGRMDSC